MVEIKPFLDNLTKDTIVFRGGGQKFKLMNVTQVIEDKLIVTLGHIVAHNIIKDINSCQLRYLNVMSVI